MKIKQKNNIQRIYAHKISADELGLKEYKGKPDSLYCIEYYIDGKVKKRELINIYTIPRGVVLTEESGLMKKARAKRLGMKYIAEGSCTRSEFKEYLREAKEFKKEVIRNLSYRLRFKGGN